MPMELAVRDTDFTHIPIKYFPHRKQNLGSKEHPGKVKKIRKFKK